MSTRSFLHCAAGIGCAFLLAACSPKFDWREVRGGGAPYIVTLPAKPASHTREINLDGIRVAMTMTAAEVDDVTFAVGAAELPDAAQAPKALAAMKTALVRNINGTIHSEKTGTAPASIDIEASGASAPNSAGQSRLLLARFISRDKYIYQVVVVGNEKSVSREAADTFFASFRPD